MKSDVFLSRHSDSEPTCTSKCQIDCYPSLKEGAHFKDNECRPAENYGEKKTTINDKRTATEAIKTFNTKACS